MKIVEYTSTPKAEVSVAAIGRSLAQAPRGRAGRILLIGADPLLKSLNRLRSIDPGEITSARSRLARRCAQRRIGDAGTTILCSRRLHQI